MNVLDDLAADIQSQVPRLSTADAAVIAGDLASVLANGATGTPIEQELAHILARTANLAAGEIQQITQVFARWSQNLITGIVLGLVT